MRPRHILLAFTIAITAPLLTAVLLVRRSDEPIFRSIPNEQVEHLGLSRAIGVTPKVSKYDTQVIMGQISGLRNDLESVLVWMRSGAAPDKPPRLVWAVSLDVPREEELVGPNGLPARNIYEIAFIDAVTGEFIGTAGLQRLTPGETPAVSN